MRCGVAMTSFRGMWRTTLTTLTLAMLPHAGFAQATAREIVDRVDRMMRGRSSHGVMQMEVVTEHWTRALEMEVWSLGTDYALIRVNSPRREAGTATLKVVKEVWNYLPRVDRTIKIPPSLMMSSWMGSHFTNDDLVKESRIIDDYDIEIAYQGLRDGVAVWEFDLTPKPEVPVVWGRIVQQVRQADLMPVWVHYYDDVGELARTMTFHEYQTMGDRLVPALSIIRPADKPEESTTIRYTSLTFDMDIDEAFFSLRRLRQSGQ